MEVEDFLNSLPRNSTDKPAIFDYTLQKLTHEQRLIFTSITSVLLVLTLIGNFATIYIAIRRSIRPFFRACLISLACSDLFAAIFTSTTYLTQFSTEYLQTWHLGETLCSLVPFVSTLAILVNSMTLVSIATDRYMAITKLVRGTWEPGGLLSGTCMLLLWGISTGVASPMIFSYEMREFSIFITDPSNGTIVDSLDVDICYVNPVEREEKFYYYVVVFAVIFLPMVGVFLWLNTFIAHEIWIRRRTIASKRNPITTTTTNLMVVTPQKSTTKTPNSSCEKCTTIAAIAAMPGPSSDCQDADRIDVNAVIGIPTVRIQFCEDLNDSTLDSKPKTKDYNQNSKNNDCNGSSSKNHDRYTSKTDGHVTMKRPSRETRQLRIFAVILLLMAVFLLCRLPTWIYLIIRLYGPHTLQIHYVLHFSLGILSLSSCFLNPLFYTFLTETIQYTVAMGKKIKSYCFFTLPKWRCSTQCCSCWSCCNNGANMDPSCTPGNENNREIYTILRG